MRVFALPGALAYVLWGLLNVYRGVSELNELAFSQTVQTEGGWLAHYHFNFVWQGALALVLGVFFVWRNNKVAYWLAAVVVTAADLGYILFRTLPGFATPPHDLADPILGASAILLSTLAMLTRPKSRPAGRSDP